MRGDLNYHHLRYFWAVARDGSIVKASRRLHVAQATISGQIKELESQIGEELFHRIGRRLELTETGRTVLAYCDEIFAIGQELGEALNGRGIRRLPVLHVGIADALPKLIAHRLLAPALSVGENVRLRCVEDPPEKLVEALAVHDLDVVLSDQAMSGSGRSRVHSHLLGTSAVSLFGTRAFRTLHNAAPADLHDQPVIMPAPGSPLRRLVEDHFAHQGIRPRIAVECEDNALLLAFGRAGVGLVPAAMVLAQELKRMYGLTPITQLPEVHQRYYAITIERRITHPAIEAITRTALETLDQPRHP